MKIVCLLFPLVPLLSLRGFLFSPSFPFCIRHFCGCLFYTGEFPGLLDAAGWRTQARCLRKFHRNFVQGAREFELRNFLGVDWTFNCCSRKSLSSEGDTNLSTFTPSATITIAVSDYRPPQIKNRADLPPRELHTSKTECTQQLEQDDRPSNQE